MSHTPLIRRMDEVLLALTSNDIPRAIQLLECWRTELRAQSARRTRRLVEANVEHGQLTELEVLQQARALLAEPGFKRRSLARVIARRMGITVRTVQRHLREVNATTVL